jgi:hypothetical protein
MLSKEFLFTEAMIEEAKKKGVCKGCNPLPNALENCSHDFVITTWDLWYYMIPKLRKKLKKCLKKKFKRSISRKIIATDNNLPLFELLWKDEKFKFIILEQWAAETMELPKVHTFQKSGLYDTYCKYMS